MGEETWEEDLSPSYSNKTPEVERLYLFEKSEWGKRKWFDSVSCLANQRRLRKVQVLLPPFKAWGFYIQISYLCAF